MYRYQFRIALARGFDDHRPDTEWVTVGAVTLEEARFKAHAHAEGFLTDEIIYHTEYLMSTTDPCADRTQRVKLFVWIGLPSIDGDATFVACAPSLNDARVAVGLDERATIETVEAVGVRPPDYCAFTHDPVAVSLIP